MSLLEAEGFDGYASTADMTLAGYPATPNMGFVAAANTLFGRGQGCAPSAATTIARRAYKTAANETTIYGSIRFKYNSGSSSSTSKLVLELRDGTTSGTQVSLVIVGDGSVEVRSGGSGGTLLGSAASVFALNTWNSLQFKFVINNTTGSAEVRLNGAASAISGLNLTGVNTRAGTANNYANTWALTNSGANNYQADDIWMNNDDGTAPTGWPADRYCQQLFPESMVQTQLTPTGTITVGDTATTASATYNTGTMWTTPAITMARRTRGTIATINLRLNTNLTGNAKIAIYAADGSGGAPGTLLGTSNVVTNPTTGGTAFTFSPPVAVARSTAYYFALLTDANISLRTTGGTGSTYSQSVAYASGFPSTAAGTNNPTGGRMSMDGTVTVTNDSAVSEDTEDDTTTTVTGGTVGLEDIYEFSDLATAPPAVYLVQVVTYWWKSDAGARTGGLSMDANGSGDTSIGTQVLSTLKTRYEVNKPLDPTGAAWTAGNVNSMKIGLSVAA